MQRPTQRTTAAVHAVLVSCWNRCSVASRKAYVRRAAILHRISGEVWQRRGLRGLFVCHALARWLPLPGLRACQGLAQPQKTLYLSMRRLRQPNFGDVRHRYARLEAAAHPLVLGGLSCGQPFQRAFGATTQKTEIPCRNKDEPPAGGQGRSHRGKILVACAAEVKERALCRIRLNKIDDFSKASLHAFVE